MARDDGHRTRDLLLVMLVAALFALPRAAYLAHEHSESSDDDYHLVRGVEFLQRDGSLVLRHLANPLTGEGLAALPLWLLGADTHTALLDTAIHGQRFTPEAATLAVALWKAALYVPLVGLAFAWGRGLYGRPAGLCAAGLFLAEPSFAAHAHLATVDVLSAETILLALWTGWRYLERPGRGRAYAASAALALALLTKHTALIVPAIMGLFALLHWLGARRRAVGDSPAGLAAHVAVLARAAVLTVLFMWAFLGFDLSAPRGLPALPGGTYVQTLRDGALHNSAPPTAYLLGQIKAGGWWYYFPVVAAHKVPLGVVSLVALAGASLLWRRPRWDELALAVPLVAFTAFLMAQNMNIGWRHFFAPYAMLLILAGRALAPPDRAGWGRLAVPLRAVAAGAVLVTAVEQVRWLPDTIAYINFDAANRWLDVNDSNLDWGQGLKQARAWIDANPGVIRGRTVSFRGVTTANRAVRYYLGDRVTNLRDYAPRPTAGLLIVSPIALTGQTEIGDRYGPLRPLAPIAVISRTLRVYDLDALAAAGLLAPAPPR